MQRLGLLALLLATAGCTMAPAYQQPQTLAPAAFKELPEGWVAATPLDAAPRGAWWAGFNDPVLNDLIERSHAASPTLVAALARYDAALAAARLDRSALFPTVTAGAAVERARVSEGRPPAGGARQTYTLSSVGGALDYEIDLWGRIRDSVSASRAEAQASEADLQSARLSLDAAVADAYVRLRGLDAQDQLLRRSALAFQRAYELTATRHEGGISSGIDVNRARTQLASARAEISAIANQRAAAEHELAALTGALASDFAIPAAAEVPAMQGLRATAPSELLQRRPDIAAAERRVFAANSRIGVARAAFFPSLTLGADAGYQTVTGALLSAPNGYWALGPLSAALTLFDGGRRKAQVRISQAEHEETAAAYRETVLGAFREVEDALAALRHLATQSSDQQEAATAANRTSALAMQRYRDGASDYLDVVTAQTAALGADRDVLNIQTQQARAQIKLVRGLGGPDGGSDVKPRQLRHSGQEVLARPVQFNRSDLADFGYFLAIARNRSFSRAGVELGVSASALSHALKGLEARLGVRLLHRTNRSVTLTSAGEAFRDAIAEHLDAIDRAVEVLNQYRDAPAGRIRLNVVESAARLILAPVLPEFIRRYPDIQIDLSVSNRMIDVIDHGFDAGIRFGGTVPEDMVAQRISANLRWMVAGAPAYFAQHGHPQTPDDLLQHQCLQIRLGNNRIYRWELEKDGEEVTLAVPGPLTIDSSAMLLAMARSGVGLIYSAELALAEDIAAGRLEPTLRDWAPMGEGFYLYYSSRRQLPVGLRLLVDLIRELRPLGL